MCRDRLRTPHVSSVSAIGGPVLKTYTRLVACHGEDASSRGPAFSDAASVESAGRAESHRHRSFFLLFLNAPPTELHQCSCLWFAPRCSSARVRRPALLRTTALRRGRGPAREQTSSEHSPGDLRVFPAREGYFRPDGKGIIFQAVPGLPTSVFLTPKPNQYEYQIYACDLAADARPQLVSTGLARVRVLSFIPTASRSFSARRT